MAKWDTSLTDPASVLMTTFKSAFALKDLSLQIVVRCATQKGQPCQEKVPKNAWVVVGLLPLRAQGNQQGPNKPEVHGERIRIQSSGEVKPIRGLPPSQGLFGPRLALNTLTRHTSWPKRSKRNSSDSSGLGFGRGAKRGRERERERETKSFTWEVAPG